MQLSHYIFPSVYKSPLSKELLESGSKFQAPKLK